MTTGEILEKALLNTALGMGTVFAMLIFMCLVISCFKFLPKSKAEISKPTSTASMATGADARACTGAGTEIGADPDEELVPVIIAAILASKGISPANAGNGTTPYIVRSIRRIR